VILLFFEAVSGLKVNLSRSVLVHVVTVNNVDKLAGILGCGTSPLPLKYLGILLGASYKAKAIWDGIMEKMEHRLASWKMMYLSKGGRVMLIKELFSTYLHLSYLFSLFLLVWPIE
jgi:hypothetical protein